jgi:hypothetical protein
MDPLEELQKVIDEVRHLQAGLPKGSSQVRSADDRDRVKATVSSWMKSHRPALATITGLSSLEKVDLTFNRLLEFSDRSVTGARYKEELKQLSKDLFTLRTEVVASLNTGQSQRPTGDSPPSFSPLVQDAEMVGILTRRWDEICRCMSAGAPLAATVMMGGLLEGLLLARVNLVANKTVLFQTGVTPKDKSGKPLKLQEWKLSHYIEVAHAVKWIRQAARDLSVILRDYRNYIHPSKEFNELAKGNSIESPDVSTFWAVFKEVAVQIIHSVKQPL